MPTYEYECQKCKAIYELRQSFSAESTHTCEECGKGIAKRILHAPKVHFKGSGFYATDSKSKSSALSDSKPAAESDSGASTPAESSAAPAAASSTPSTEAAS